MTNQHSSGASDFSQWSTYAEIQAQPAIWRDWFKVLGPQLPALQEWLRHSRHDAVWFCGAGTSSFIGETLASYFNSSTKTVRFRAIATTDLVAQPGSYFPTGIKLLVVSFGRSGNSSESIGTLNVLDTLAADADRLHITCNEQGALSTRTVPGPGALRTIVLPPQTNDVGFAMTSSYTTMLLTALACFDEQAPMPLQQSVALLADAATALLQHCTAQAASEQFSMPQRVVFLGSGALSGAARESSLKVLELSAGAIPTLWDSSLGFRHGPKAFMTVATRAYIFVSSDPHTQAYELDVAKEIRAQFGAHTVVTIGPEQAGCDVILPTVGNDAWTCVLYVLLAQFLAMQWSHAMGLNVDHPFANGNLSRVVTGVRLYPFVFNGLHNDEE